MNNDAAYEKANDGFADLPLKQRMKVHSVDDWVSGYAQALKDQQRPKVKGPIVITKARQICHGAPSSWRAWDAEGKEYSLTYRWGIGLLRDDQSHMIAKYTTRDPYGGVCTLGEFAEEIGGYIELSEDLEYV